MTTFFVLAAAHAVVLMVVATPDVGPACTQRMPRFVHSYWTNGMLGEQRKDEQGCSVIAGRLAPSVALDQSTVVMVRWMSPAGADRVLAQAGTNANA